MYKYSINIVFIVLLPFAFDVSANSPEVVAKLKIQELSRSCPSAPFNGNPKTAIQMFCSGGFNELAVRHCVRANLDLGKHNETISTSYSTFDDKKEMKVSIKMKCSDIEI